MPKLYVDANPKMVAYVLEDGDSGYQKLRELHTAMEAEYIAVMYGINEYFLRWSSELDPRYGDLNIDKMIKTGEVEFSDTATPSEQTIRPLPPPVLVCSDNEVVVKQLSREYHIGNEKLRKLAQMIWQATKNVDVKFQWIPRAENIAGKMLK